MKESKDAMNSSSSSLSYVDDCFGIKNQIAPNFRSLLSSEVENILFPIALMSFRRRMFQ